MITLRKLLNSQDVFQQVSIMDADRKKIVYAGELGRLQFGTYQPVSHKLVTKAYYVQRIAQNDQVLHLHVSGYDRIILGSTYLTPEDLAMITKRGDTLDVED